jgi:hypothetical protein
LYERRSRTIPKAEGDELLDAGGQNPATDRFAKNLPVGMTIEKAEIAL